MSFRLSYKYNKSNKQLKLYLFLMASKLSADYMSGYISQYRPLKSLSISLKPAELLRGKTGGMERDEQWLRLNRGLKHGQSARQETPECSEF